MNIEDFINSKKSLKQEFIKIGLTRGDSDNFIQNIFNYLPNDIKNCSVFEDILHQILYKFGDNLVLDNNSPIITFGGNDNPRLEVLYNAIKLAKNYLTDQDFISYMKKIGNPKRHEDFLFEMRPLLNIKEDIKIIYESMNNCNNNKNIDREFSYNGTTILVEMKNRKSSTSYSISQTMKLVAGEIPKVNPPDPGYLFNDVIEKFKDRNNKNMLQGVWINTGIREDGENLKNYFDNLNSKKIQFAIISGRDDHAYILTKDILYKNIVTELFGITYSEDFLYDYSNHHV